MLVSNANMLYMQSTPMTEALLYCFITAMIFYVQRWAATGRYQYLILGGLASLLGYPYSLRELANPRMR